MGALGRTPGHDAYWYYSPSFFDTVVPPAGEADAGDRLRRGPGGP